MKKILLFLTLIAGGCAHTPEFDWECKDHFVEAQEIKDCKDRVEAKARSRARKEEYENKKAACRVPNVWKEFGMRSGECVEARTIWFPVQ